MSDLRNVLRFCAWLLPRGSRKNALLRRLGHDLHPTVAARPNVVWKVDFLRCAADSSIGLFNVITSLRALEIGEGASVGRLNVIGSEPVFTRLSSTGAHLVMGRRSYVTSHHDLDCSGGLSIGQFSAIAGHQTRVVTHGIDVERDAMSAASVIIGDRSFVGARCLLLGGARLPDRSVLAAGSVLVEASDDQVPGLWAGNPAGFKKSVSGTWFDRDDRSTTRLLIPETGELVENALGPVKRPS